MSIKLLTTGLITSVLMIQPAIANDVLDEREQHMKTLGKEVKTMASMVKGRSDFDADQFVSGAWNMSDAMEGMLDLFPAGSHGGDSAAKAKIWDNWEDFVAKYQAAVEATDNLADAADEGDETTIKKAFGKVGKSCSSCHRQYRIKRD